MNKPIQSELVKNPARMELRHHPFAKTQHMHSTVRTSHVCDEKVEAKGNSQLSAALMLVLSCGKQR
jgi:hypothetical protein